MRNSSNHTFACLSIFLFCASVLNGCAQEKTSVGVYRDTSSSPSAAQAPVSKPNPVVASREPLSGQAVSPPPVQPPPSSQEKMASSAVLSLLTLTDDRIVAYEDKVEQWKMHTAESSSMDLDEEQLRNVTDCRERLLSILTEYNDLHQQLIGDSARGADSEIIEKFLAVERQDMAYMESDCRQAFTPGQTVPDTLTDAGREALLREKTAELNEKTVAGDYAAVIELYGQLPLREGERPSFEAAYNHGQALLRMGREEEASAVFRDLLAGLRAENQIEREFSLMKLIADIRFGMGDYDMAFERYVDIINRYAGLGENIDWARKQQTMISVRNSQAVEVKNFAALLQGYLSYNPDRDAYRVSLMASRFLADFPQSIVIPAVNQIMFESGNLAEAWFDRLRGRVSMLRTEKKYQEALQVLDGLPLADMPQDKQDVVVNLRDELVAVSAQEEEARRLAQEQAMQEIWDKGQELLRAREYDQAMEVFSRLLDTTNAERATEKIAEASQLAAQEDRRTAAELYVRSTQTADQEQRMSLLIKSRHLLKGILKKYRQSDLVDKVEKNLEKIEQEIAAIDPSLLTEPEDDGPEEEERSQQPVETMVQNMSLGGE